MATHAETTYELTWEHGKRIAQLADASASRRCCRWPATAVWAARRTSTAPTTRPTRGRPVSPRPPRTSWCHHDHVPTKHPIVAAKESVTVDHISGGRHGLNMTMGWYKAEMEMFGGTQREHDIRYRYGSEWIEVVKRMWTEGEGVNFTGEFFEIKDAFSPPSRSSSRTRTGQCRKLSGRARILRPRMRFNFIDLLRPAEAKDTAARVRGTRPRPGQRSRNPQLRQHHLPDTEKATKQLLDHILDQGDGTSHARCPADWDPRADRSTRSRRCRSASSSVTVATRSSARASRSSISSSSWSRPASAG
ncbi:LLM class flavin-dependent oxidoreductase [Rhodococcus hoagii]|nr:LLM class flavin-dependent oxidoreductase [Prescottella equi]